MLSLFKSKNRVKFDVTLQVDELTNVPISNASMYVKWKLKSGGKSAGSTERCVAFPFSRSLTHLVATRASVSKHVVTWNQSFPMEVVMATDETTAHLRGAQLQLTVRSETSGSKEDELLGYVNVELAEFALGRPTVRKYLLLQSRYNSTLQITVTMRQTAGDPHFKAFAFRMTLFSALLAETFLSSRAPTPDMSSLPALSIKASGEVAVDHVTSTEHVAAAPQAPSIVNPSRRRLHTVCFFLGHSRC